MTECVCLFVGSETKRSFFVSNLVQTAEGLFHSLQYQLVKSKQTSCLTTTQSLITFSLSLYTHTHTHTHKQQHTQQQQQHMHTAHQRG